MKPTIVGLLVVPLLFCIFVSSSVATISPTTLTATLNPEESISETKTVDLPAEIPIGDIVFAFDLTASMYDELSTAKAEAINIMNALDAVVSDAQYGVMSYMDYPKYYDSYDYAAQYGDPDSGDYAYSLDQPITSDRPAVSAAINSLTLGFGEDGPEAYTRIMYESYADPAIGWRPGSKRILLNFGDAVPHDDNLNEGVPGKTGTLSTGGDPGRDEVMFTDDDLDLQTVLAEMASNHVTLLEIHSEGIAFEYWEYWTSITGGTTFDLASPAGIPDAIFTVIGEEAAFVSTLTLETNPGYESWLTSVTPSSYTDLDLPATVTFDVEVTVPTGTPSGTYTFEIIAVGDGASYGEQLVTITVPVQPVNDVIKPVANAGPDQTVTEDMQLTFDGSGSTDNVGIVSYVWTFTDVTPKTLTGVNPTYTFATPSTYTVTLNVTDAAGNWDTDTVIITVSPATPSDGTGQDGTQPVPTPPDVTKPVANAGPDKMVVEGNVVSFYAGGSSDNMGIVSYEWDFGDGTTGTGITLTHTYTEPGTYTVTLTVKDAAGNSQTDSVTITVQKDTDGDGDPDITDADDDNDEMPDEWEIDNGLDPLDAQDASLDSDNDGLTNFDEYLQSKNPNAYDAEVVYLRPLYVVGAAVGALTVATGAILTNLTGLGASFDLAISKLPIPDELKQFLQLYGEKLFETVDKTKLEALEKKPFITRGEVAALGVSALIATIVFGVEEANGLQNFLTTSGLVNFIPPALVSVCVVIIFAELFEACCARICRVHKQFRLWMYGTIMFLISGLVFQFPLGSPGITRYRSGEISKKAKGLFVLSKMLLLLALTLPFAGLLVLGFNTVGEIGLSVGEIGLWLTLITVFSSLMPVRPLVGKALFDYRKEVSLTALAASGILLFSFIYSRLTHVTFLPYVAYLAVGAVSAVLAAITLNQLRKAHTT